LPGTTALTEGDLDSVISKDGTRIAFWRYGQGPPLVLVHGTTADHTRWAPAIPALSAEFTACALDRRGRGGTVAYGPRHFAMLRIALRPG